MNEDLQKQLAESIKGFADTMGTAKDFAIDQAPDVIQQYLAWGVAHAAIWIPFCLITMFVSYKATFKWPNQELEYGTWKMEKCILAMLGGIASSLAVIGLMVNILLIAKILISPKIYLIEQAAHLIK